MKNKNLFNNNPIQNNHNSLSDMDPTYGTYSYKDYGTAGLWGDHNMFDSMKYSALIGQIKALYRATISKNPDEDLIKGLKQDLETTFENSSISDLKNVLDNWASGDHEIHKAKNKQTAKKIHRFIKDILKKGILKKEFIKNIKRKKNQGKDQNTLMDDFWKEYSKNIGKQGYGKYLEEWKDDSAKITYTDNTTDKNSYLYPNGDFYTEGTITNDDS